MKKNIYIYSHGHTNRSFHGDTFFVPYIQLLLKTYFEKNSNNAAKVLWPDINYFGNDINAAASKVQKPFILGLSSYLWTWEKNMALAKIIKDRYPECVIVLGGPEVPVGSDDFFDKYPFIDYLVHKEGEEAFCKLIDYLIEDKTHDYIHPQVSSRRYMAKREELAGELDFNKSNFLEYLDLNLLENYKKELDEKKLSSAIVFETNRGCPYKCTFCDWGESTGRPVRNIPLDVIKKQINTIARLKFDLVFCTDANFGINKRDIEIAKMWVDAKKHYGYPKTIYFNTAKNTNKRILEIGNIIKQGFPIVAGSTISFQTMNEEVLKNVGRKNIGLKNYLNLQEEYENRGVESYSELILGLPGESKESWMQGIQYLINKDIKNFHVYPLIICENSPMNVSGDKEKFGLQVERIKRSEHSFNVDNKEMHEYANLVIGSNTMSGDEYLEMSIFSDFALTVLKTSYLKNLFRFVSINNEVGYGDFITQVYLNKEGTFLDEVFEYLKACCLDRRDYLLVRDIGKRTVTFGDTTVKNIISFQKYIELSILFNLDEFMCNVKETILNNYMVEHQALDELLTFQKQLIFKPENLITNEKSIFQFNWAEFIKGSNLVQKEQVIRFFGPALRNRDNYKELFCLIKLNSKMSYIIKGDIHNFNTIKVI